MSTGIEIRYAGRDDIYQISAFLHGCWKKAYRHIISDDYLDAMSVEARNVGLLKRFAEGVSDFIMMLDGNDLVGVAVFGKSFTDGYEEDGEVTGLYIRDDYIGKGYGRQLLMMIEQALSAKGYSRFVLDVLSNNKRAIRFYQSHGFGIVADRSIRLGDVDYPLTIMRK